MSGISAIQPASPAETWEAWQALVQATLAETGTGAALAQLDAAAHIDRHSGLQAQPATGAPMQTQAPHEVALPPLSATHEAPSVATGQPAAPSLLNDLPVAAAHLADANAAVLPMAPVLMTPLALQGGPELRWRVQDAPAWRALFEDAGHEAPDDDEAQHESLPMPAEQAPDAEAAPAWALALLARLRRAASEPACADALRPALQAWRVGLPVLLASPAGLASLQPSRDAGCWQWRRWPARWRAARPAVGERWWAVRLGLTAQGRPRTLRDLAGAAATLAPGQVSCELRLDDVAPGLAHWADVLVQAPASPSLCALLGARPSLTWLLCNQSLWEAP